MNDKNSRRCNIFTLGDFQRHDHPLHFRTTMKRSKNSDPFERDPFKIQSYNFHYAERPSYPIQSLQQRISTPSTFKCFDNFFFNYQYPHGSTRPPTSVLNNHKLPSDNYNKENQAAAGLSKYQESRRRSFIQDQSRTNNNIFNNNSFNTFAGSESHCNILSQNLPKSVSGSLLRRSCTRDDMQTIRPMSSNFRVASVSGINTSSRNNFDDVKTSITTTNLTARKSGSQSLLDILHRQSRNRLPVSSTTALYTNKMPIRDNSATRSLPPQRFTAESSIEQETETKVARKNSKEIIHSKSGNINIGKSHNFGSGCEININIKPLDSKLPGENVVIKIEADGVNKNLNYNKPIRTTTKLLTNNASSTRRLPTPSPDRRYNIKRAESSQTFIIDKNDDSLAEKRLRLSRESIQRQEEQRRKTKLMQKETERLEALQAAYKSRTSNTAPTTRTTLRRRIGSHERLPSLVSWKINDDLSSCIQKKVIDNLPTSSDKGFFQKIRDKLSYSHSDLRPRTSSRIDQNEQVPSCSNSRCTNLSRPSEEKEYKILNTATQTNTIGGISPQSAKSLRVTQRERSLMSLYKSNNDNKNNRRITSMHSMPAQNTRQSYTDLKPSQPLLYRSKSTKLPFNFSINVYADKKQKIRV
uniref:Uncharacterized protein n=1 Tax=Glossina brevipalpis TaxID=37001 RepID=A0A1A9WIY0_9MUSC